MEDNRIESEERSHFVLVPNVVDDLGLDPFSFRLYVHLRRVAGEGGECWQSTETLARYCSMSAGSVSNAKRALAGQGLIRIAKERRPDGAVYDVITIADIWQQNAAAFQSAPAAGSDLPAADPAADPAPPSELPDPAALTVAEIGGLDLSPDQWQRLLDLERAGKNRKSAIQAMRRVIAGPPPAVRVYLGVAGRWPKKGLWSAIERIVGEDEEALARWQKTVEAYILSGWNPLNIKGMLDYYQRDEIPSTTARHNGPARKPGDNGALAAWHGLERAMRESTAPDALARRALERSGLDWPSLRRLTEKEAPFAQRRFVAAYQEVLNEQRIVTT